MCAARAQSTRSREQSAGGQLALFPQRRFSVAPPRCVLVAGVDDALVERRPLPSGLVRFGADLGIRYLAGSELDAAHVTPSFWISELSPGAPSRRLLFETITNQVVEQDSSGRVWIDDDRVASGALLAFGCPAQLRENDLVLGERAALLVGCRQERGWELRVLTTARVVWIFDAPLNARAPCVAGWLRLAASDADARDGSVA